MKPQTTGSEAQTSTPAGAPGHPVVHSRVRFGRFLIGSVALVGMVAVATFTGTVGSESNIPLVGMPQSTLNASGDAGVSAPAGPGEAPAPTQPTRIGGDGSLTNAAIAVSQRAFPGGASEVYLARLDNPVDALAASVLPKGPILLVPSSGNVPPAIFGEIKRLNAQSIVVLGGSGAISDDVAAQLGTYTGKNVSRISGANRVQTAAAIARYAFPGGNPTVYLADAIGADGKGSPDAVAGGVLRDGPILTVSSNGNDVNTAAQTVKQLGANRVVALGGTAVVPETVLNQVAGGAATARLSGANRYLTSQAIAKTVFGGGASVAYITPGKNLAYSLIAGSLNDGPILLMPATSDSNTRGLVTAFGNPNVVAIGDPGSLSDNVMQVASGYAQPENVVVAGSAPVSAEGQMYIKYSQQPSPADAAREETIHNRINEVRTANGVPALQRHSMMDDAARAWAQQVAVSYLHRNSRQ